MLTKPIKRAAVAVAAIAAGVVVSAQADLDVVRVRDNVYMIAGAGANITVQFGGDGAVVVDAGTFQHADAIVAAIRKITPQPIRYVIDTSDDADHVGGNEKIAKAGRTLFQTNNQLGDSMTNGGAAAILSAEGVSKNFQLDNNSMSPVGPPCVAGYEGVTEGKVPHYLPGTNPSIDELTKFYGIPREATLGGAETMYPEFRKKIKDKFVRPDKCTQNCGAPNPQPAPPSPAGAAR